MLCTNISQYYCHILHFWSLLSSEETVTFFFFFTVNNSEIFLFWVLLQIVKTHITTLLSNDNSEPPSSLSLSNVTEKYQASGITGMSVSNLDTRRIETHYWLLFIFSPCAQWTLWHRRNGHSPVCTKETFPLNVIACFCSLFYHNDVFFF